MITVGTGKATKICLGEAAVQSVHLGEEQV